MTKLPFELFLGFRDHRVDGLLTAHLMFSKGFEVGENTIPVSTALQYIS